MLNITVVFKIELVIDYIVILFFSLSFQNLENYSFQQSEARPEFLFKQIYFKCLIGEIRNLHINIIYENACKKIKCESYFLLYFIFNFHKSMV